MIVARDAGFREARLVWDDRTGAVAGDHSRAAELAAAIADGQLIVPCPWGSVELADPAHDPSDFLTALRHYVWWPLHVVLPDSLANVTPTPFPEPPVPYGEGVVY